MVADLRYFNSLEHEVDSLKSQLENQKTQFLNEIDRLSREYYYVDHMNVILGAYTTLDKFTDLQCDYVDQVVKCERLEKELSKRTNVNNKSFNELSKRFSELEQHAINLELALQHSQEQLNNDKVWKQKESNSFRELNVKYFEIQDLKAQLHDKYIAIRAIPTTSVSRQQLKRNRLEDRVMHNNSQGREQQVEDHRRNFKYSNNITSVTAYNDSLNAKTSNVNFVCVTYGKCVLNDNHDMCVLHYINDVITRTKQPIFVPISTREPKRTVNQSVATPLKKTIVSESTNQKPRSTIRKQYEHVSETCKWWYSKITPPGYKWNPKTSTVNVTPNVSMPLGNKSRTTNISESIKLRRSTLSNTPFSSNSFAARRDNSIYRRLWVLKAHDEKSQAPKYFYGEISRNGSRGTDLYSITLQDTSTPNPICLMAKALSSQYDIVTGLPKLKFVKDYFCSSYELGKAKRKSLKTKTTPSSKRRLQIVHMDLCGPVRVESFNGKKYVLVIIDDYSRYTWTHFLRSKDETPKVLIDFLKLVQRGLHTQVRTVRTDKGTKFLNKTLHAYSRRY
ncbi:retrovirus-related pol polyprotein from transposon TNT 1-94 [Tanacetum coccineum]